MDTKGISSMNPLTKLRHLIAKMPGSTNIMSLLRLPRMLFFPTYHEDGLLTIHNCDFVKDSRFLTAYNEALKHGLVYGHIRWRAHVTQWAGFHASQLKGDFVECGVNKGFLSKSVMTYVNFRALTDRKFYLFDTFCGLVEELITQHDRGAYHIQYDDCYDFVLNSFKEYPNVVLVKGTVPDTLSKVDIKQVAYLSIDMNCVIPEIAALEHFWPKMVAGGIIILDDYGFSAHKAQKQASDEFASRKGVEVLSLPTGQGLILKP